MFAITERLLLRPGWPEDAAELTRAVARETIARNLARLPWPYTERHAAEYLSGAFARPESAFLIFSRTGGPPQLVGGIGIHPDPEARESAHEMGYWIAEEHWGKGFATEAGAAVVALARDSLKLPRLNAGHFVDNPASGRVLAKLGFRRTGRIVPRHSLGRGHAAPCALMTLAFGEEDEGCDPVTRMAA